jgi:hypothetical protein
MSQLFRACAFLSIALAITLALSVVRSSLAVNYLDCSVKWKEFTIIKCKGKVPCASAVVCVNSPSLPPCPSGGKMLFKSTTPNIADAGYCDGYDPSTCVYCPGFFYCVEYQVFPTKDGNAKCIMPCDYFWYESVSPDRCK